MRTRAVLVAAFGFAAAALPGSEAAAFCGFYVAKADTKLYNDASKVVIARHDGKTVITMVNDYRGAPDEFAMVIPVPDVLERGQIHVTENAVVDHLDAYTAPRLVEYFDPDPCRVRLEGEVMQNAMPKSAAGRATSADALGVAVEARYTVGEYDIIILSAEESSGLKTWLVGNGYRLPEGVEPVLDEYLDAGMKFFVARVNLAAKERIGREFLRPLQIAFESEHFMLPIKLGMVNASGPQELFVLTLTRSGRVETRNYRTVKMPSNLDVPIFVREEFGGFYNALFDRQVAQEDGRAVFLEYAWDMAWCDPCAAEPLTADQLRELGVFWLAEQEQKPTAGAQDVFVTRLHLRYDAAHFPDDLVFHETEDRSNFQGRYVLRHPWTGTPECDAAKTYLTGLPDRFEREAQRLAALTGWPIANVRAKMERHGQSFSAPKRPASDDRTWWERLWGEG